MVETHLEEERAFTSGVHKYFSVMCVPSAYCTLQNVETNALFFFFFFCLNCNVAPSIESAYRFKSFPLCAWNFMICTVLEGGLTMNDICILAFVLKKL